MEILLLAYSGHLLHEHLLCTLLLEDANFQFLPLNPGRKAFAYLQVWAWRGLSFKISNIFKISSCEAVLLHQFSSGNPELKGMRVNPDSDTDDTTYKMEILVSKLRVGMKIG